MMIISFPLKFFYPLIFRSISILSDEKIEEKSHKL